MSMCAHVQDFRGLVQGGDHTAQALQGLTFGGNSDGIGIGLGMLQQQAHAHASNQMPFQFNKQVRQSIACFNQTGVAFESPICKRPYVETAQCGVTHCALV